MAFEFASNINFRPYTKGKAAKAAPAKPKAQPKKKPAAKK
jgi:hypothetical protein